MGEEERKQKEKAKKQVPLRLSATLWNDLAAWAEDDFRSINGQIEYLLTECVKYRKKHCLDLAAMDLPMCMQKRIRMLNGN